MRGRPPTPSVLKLLRGNPGKRAINKAEPTIKASIPTCPPELSDRAKKEWKRISKILLAAGILTHADRAALSSYCVNWAIWIEAVEKVRDTGTVVKGIGTLPKMNPYLIVAKIAHDQMKAMMGELGLSASSQSRLIASKGTDEANPWAS